MSMSAILIAALVMSVLGLLFGALLGVTGRVFKVPVNEKAEALRECLPGANCGACGFPGCDGYAAAVADGKAEVGACAVGGPACAAKMGEIMGVSVSASVRMVASVACQGYGDHCKPKADYQGMTDCVAASLVNNGTKACQYACLGLGTCERACPFDAIHIDPIKQIAVVDEEKCQPVKSALRLAASMCFPCVRWPRGECWLSQSGKGHRFEGKMRSCLYRLRGMREGL